MASVIGFYSSQMKFNWKKNKLSEINSEKEGGNVVGHITDRDVEYTRENNTSK